LNTKKFIAIAGNIGVGKSTLTALPEVRRYADVCYVAANAGEFQACVARALEEDTSPLAGDLRSRRREIAAQNSWQSRVAEIRKAINMNPKTNTPSCL